MNIARSALTAALSLVPLLGFYGERAVIEQNSISESVQAHNRLVHSRHER